MFSTCTTTTASSPARISAAGRSSFPLAACSVITTVDSRTAASLRQRIRAKQDLHRAVCDFLDAEVRHQRLSAKAHITHDVPHGIWSIALTALGWHDFALDVPGRIS
jgi:hypothetical protein